MSFSISAMGTSVPATPSSSAMRTWERRLVLVGRRPGLEDEDKMTQAARSPAPDWLLELVTKVCMTSRAFSCLVVESGYYCFHLCRSEPKICSMVYSGLKCESSSSHFQPGEGPSRGLLCDCEPSCGPSFPALMAAALVRGTAWDSLVYTSIQQTRQNNPKLVFEANVNIITMMVFGYWHELVTLHTRYRYKASPRLNTLKMSQKL